MSTIYPNDYDSDLELPRVEDDVSEVSAVHINPLRDAIISIQKTVGLNPQGNLSSLAQRVGVSLDENGRIRASALSEIGAITDITNSQISPHAMIEESKLQLSYTTQYLNGQIESIQSNLSNFLAAITGAGDNFNEHVLGLDDHHNVWHISVVPTSPWDYDTNSLGATLSGITEFLYGPGGHVDSTLVAPMQHTADVIAVDTTNFSLISSESSSVQEALDSLDSSSGILGIDHQDVFHSNGILKETSSGRYHNPSKLKMPSRSASYNLGESVVTISLEGSETFDQLGVREGDILLLEDGYHQIRATGPVAAAEGLGGLPTLDANQLAVFHVFSETGSALAEIYGPSSVYSELAPLACAVRNNNTVVDTITIMQPNAARVVSIGFNGALVASGTYNLVVEVGVGNGERTLTVNNLERDRLSVADASPVSSFSVANRINAQASIPGEHFPITAYAIGDEIAIAHNWVGEGYTLRILDSGTGNYALGLDGYGADVVDQILNGSDNNNYVVNGKTLDYLAVTFEGQAIKADPLTTRVELMDNGGNVINPLSYGISPGSIMHVVGHANPDINGSYTLYASNVLGVDTFAGDEISAGNFAVFFYYSDISLSALSSTETYEGLLDIYVNESGQTYAHQRLTIESNSWFKVTNISPGFGSGELSLFFADDGTEYSTHLQLDDGTDVLDGVQTKFLAGFLGTFRVFHPDGLNFIEVEMIDWTSPASGSFELISDAKLPEDEAMLLATIRFNGDNSITDIMDKRLFGNMGYNQIREDFVDGFSRQPISDLRSNGVVRGFDVIDAECELESLPALPIGGGVAYVNGSRVAVETQKVIVPAGNSIVVINEKGTIMAVNSSLLTELWTDGKNSCGTYGKMLPLYKVTVAADVVQEDETLDLRRFINNLDDKIEIIVDQTNNLVGNFMSLEGALEFARDFPEREKLVIRIINTVELTGPVTVPDNVTITGGLPYGGSKHKIECISAVGISSPLITLEGNNRIDNIKITGTTDMAQPLLFIGGDNVVIDSCSIGWGDKSISVETGLLGIDISGPGADESVVIKNCIFSNVYSAISVTKEIENLFIHDNIIDCSFGNDHVSDFPHGILVSNSAPETSNNIKISDNTINVQEGSLVRPIYCYSLGSLAYLEVRNNKIFSELDKSAFGIFVGGNTTIAKIENNTVEGVFNTAPVWGIQASADDLIIRNNILSEVGDISVGSIAIEVLAAERCQIAHNTIKDCELDEAISVGSVTEHAVVSNNLIVDVDAAKAICLGSGAACAENNTILDGTTGEGICASNAASELKIIGNTVRGVASFTPLSFPNATELLISANYVEGGTSNCGADPVFGTNYGISDEWHEIGVLDNSWVDFDGAHNTAAYYKHADRVYLKGRIRDGTVGNPAFSLPLGYRPVATCRFIVESNDGVGLVTIAGDGEVTPIAPSNNASVSLDGISFRIV